MWRGCKRRKNVCAEAVVSCRRKRNRLNGKVKRSNKSVEIADNRRNYVGCSGVKLCRESLKSEIWDSGVISV